MCMIYCEIRFDENKNYFKKLYNQEFIIDQIFKAIIINYKISEKCKK